MKVLIACEESQEVCKAFREKGHEAYSCDIIEPSGGHPEWHIMNDAIITIRGGQITTMDNQIHNIDKWDLIIAHPPCTRLCNSGQRWLYWGDIDYQEQKRKEKEQAVKFFMEFVNFAEKSGVKMAIENPSGIMSTLYRKPDFTYNPYDFKGETECKKTCIWAFNGLPPLKPTQKLPKELRTQNIWKSHFEGKAIAWNSPECAKFRSKTPKGVAEAMADQWGNI